MPQLSAHMLELFDAAGTPRGLLLSPELWAKVKPKIETALLKALYEIDPSARPAEPEKPERLDDWQSLLDVWDFTYPPDYDVSCEHCGNSTEDWSKDTPRKFRLIAANIGGLVTFQCQQCRSLVLKKHFKRHIATECQPYVDRGKK